MYKVNLKLTVRLVHAASTLGAGCTEVNTEGDLGLPRPSKIRKTGKGGRKVECLLK